MSRNLLASAVVIAGALGLADAGRAEVPQIAVDIAPVHSLVVRVMQGVGTPDLIVPPGASPHGYSLRPSQAQAVQDAGLVVWIGPELEPWLAQSIETLAPDAATLALLDVPGTTVHDVREGALFDPSEHHDDHDHGERNSHAWLDPGNAGVWLDAIAAALSKADPENAAAYRANAADGKAEMDKLSAQIEDTLAPVRGRQFIVFHDAYQYFETAFDMPASGAISIGDASTPGPARIGQIRDRVADGNVTCVLAEPQFNSKLARTVLDGTDARLAVLDPMGSDLEPGVALYPQLLRNLARSLADCL